MLKWSARYAIYQRLKCFLSEKNCLENRNITGQPGVALIYEVVCAENLSNIALWAHLCKSYPCLLFINGHIIKDLLTPGK